jgi:folate-binding protein YgfZ
LLRGWPWDKDLPERPLTYISKKEEQFGELYLANHPRTGTAGYDLFAPLGALEALFEQFLERAKALGGGACGWQALELARVEAGIPRFGADMDETNLPPEAGLEGRAVSYSKGCYIGQEVISRIRAYGQVAKSLRGLNLARELKQLPRKRDKLFKEGREVGYITSAAASPAVGENIALGYVRRETNLPGTEVVLRMEWGESAARIVDLPFSRVTSG